MKITIIVGLPGSGKTTYGNTLEGVFIDDLSIVGLDILQKEIKSSTPHIIISDVFLCREKDRSLAQIWLQQNAPEYEVDWIFFENNPEKCRNNVKRRMKAGDDRKVFNLIDELSRVYRFPYGEVPKNIFAE